MKRSNQSSFNPFERKQDVDIIRNCVDHVFFVVLQTPQSEPLQEAPQQSGARRQGARPDGAIMINSDIQ
jgi:hypothetical protein